LSGIFLFWTSGAILRKKTAFLNADLFWSIVVRYAPTPHVEFTSQPVIRQNEDKSFWHMLLDFEIIFSGNFI
jgi:hypothetical protein